MIIMVLGMVVVLGICTLCGSAWALNDMVSYWKFDEGDGTTAYDSAGTNDGTIYGAAWTNGQLGGALDFDGVDDYVDMADTVKNYLGTNYTVSAWIKTNTVSSDKAISGYRHSTDVSPVLFNLGHGYAEVRFVVRDNSSNIATATYANALTTNAWYHVAGTREGNVLNVYVDGASGIPDSEAFGAISPDNLKIGTHQFGGNPPLDFFDGTIDDVRIYNRALSAGEIEQLHSFGVENLLINGSFETQEIISGGWPSVYGDWGGDHSYIFAQYGNIWPLHGSKLLQFVASDHFGAGGPYGACSVYQIVDVSAFAGEIAEGRVTVSGSVYFNRVAGGPDTDTRFTLDIRAFAGDPCSFPYQQEQLDMDLAVVSVSVFTDSDPATWELGEAQLALPTNTDFVVVGLNAVEDICNDPCWPEYEGHFADAASLVMVIEPNVPEPEGIYYVDGVNGSDDSNGLTPETAFATVQKGIDTATDGNTVIVYPAVYNEEIDFLGKAITVQGMPNLAGAPILEAPGDYAVSFYRLEGPDSLLKNFVIRGSDLGIFIVGGSPTISNVTVVDNVFGIAAYAGAQPDISNSIIWNNTDGGLFGDPDPLQARYSFIQDVNEPNGPNVPSVPLSGLVSNWKFDEGQGSIAHDSAGNNDGTVNGATWTTGQVNGALSFDGSNNYVSVPHDPALNITGDITISTWICLNEGALYEAIVTKCVGNGTSYDPYDFRSTLSNLTLVRADASGHERVYCNLKIPLGQWHHGLVRVENKVPDFYVDGVITGKSADVIFTRTPVGNTNPVLIGRRNDGHYFNGKIDDVRIYDRALSAEEIEQLYQNGLGGSGYVDGFLFGDRTGGDYHLLSERGRYWPAHDVWVLDKVTSPCVDGGDPAVNPSNEPMPNGSRINMGAYGNTAYASMSEWPIPEDNNRDGIVNMLDIAGLAAKWLEKLDWVE